MEQAPKGMWDAFLILPGVDGESKVEGHDKEIEITSFSINAGNGAIVGRATNVGAGTATLSKFTFEKFTDLASARLFQACSKGERFETATVKLYRAATTPINFLTFEFQEVFVSDFGWFGSEGDSGNPRETVSFSYEKVVATYVQEEKGKPKGSVVGTWDAKTRG